MITVKKILVLPLVATIISVILFSVHTVTAAGPLDLTGVDSFALFAHTYTDTNGGTHLNGDLGYAVAPASFPIVSGMTITSASPAYTTALTAVNALYTAATTAGQSGSCTSTIGVQTDLSTAPIPGNPIIGTLTPGIYCIGAATSISNGLTLNGDGLYIFRIDGTLTADPLSQITLIGAQADKVFWVPTGGTTINAESIFAGIILTRAATTILDNVSMDGRILSNGAVTTTGPADTITAPLVTIAPSLIIAEIENDDCNDCVPPTLGLSSNSVRKVDQGFSYNGRSSNVELFLTPIQLSTTKVGDANKAVFKIYEAGGPDEIRHFELIFGLAKGQILGDSKAVIELDRSWDGINTFKVIDPENSLKDVRVETSKGACRAASVSTNDCLIVTIYHTFTAPLDFDIIATSVWDEHRNAWQNYFTPGVKVVDASVSSDSFSDILPVIPPGLQVLISDLNVTKSIVIGDTA
ncbi:MAG TPA: ice-binding family protein, partial [Candidatus Nitrosotenuis sp.]